ncbi:hypothetical protein HOY80DRAFT_988961 [Tuber brumale]|nr:hypothetical protein HOY80DRAFT_988961 [Tuber brumale]
MECSSTAAVVFLGTLLKQVSNAYIQVPPSQPPTLIFTRMIHLRYIPLWFWESVVGHSHRIPSLTITHSQVLSCPEYGLLDIKVVGIGMGIVAGMIAVAGMLRTDR